MAGAVASAMDQIGEPRALPALRRLHGTDGAEEIDGLDRVIAGLEGRAGLLRPANDTEAGTPLLRPARAQGGCEDEASLLRHHIEVVQTRQD
jgi:hypothetical protein